MSEIQEYTEDITIEDISWDDIINSIDTEALSDKDAEALSFMLVGYSIPESANMAGISPSTWRRHIKENEVIQSALTHKKKMMMALMLNKFQKQMLRALDMSNGFLMRESITTTIDSDGNVVTTMPLLSKSETSIYLKQITHAEWVINTFMKMMNSNPLEGLSISKTGDGDMNFILNVDGTSALDYLKRGMSSGKPIVMPEQEPQYIANVPLLDDRGLPPFGTFGNWSYDEMGGIVCHVCGGAFKSKQAFTGHIGTHNMNKDTYEEVYNVLWEEII